MSSYEYYLSAIKSEFREQSCDWFYGHLQKQLHDFGSAKVIKSVGYNNHSVSIDAAAATVRDHIEKVVESLVGENLDSVNIIRLSKDPNYERLFEEYHQKLSDSLALLAHAIQLVIDKHPTVEDDPTPTTAHIGLKAWVERLVEDVAEHPIVSNSSTTGDNNSEMLLLPRELAGDNEMYFADTYEDLLATAIINKVVTSRRRPPNAIYHRQKSANDPVGETEEECGGSGSSSGCNGDSGSGGQSSSAASRSGTSRLSSMSSGCDGRNSNSMSTAESPSDEELSSALSIRSQMSDSPLPDDDCCSPASSESPQYLIEEEILEITEYKSDDEGDRSLMTMRVTPRSTLSKYPSMHSVDCILAELNCAPEVQERVAFPEFGVDLIATVPDDTEDHISLHLLATHSWQDNWLFCQRRHSAARRTSTGSVLYQQQEPVAMLVPNPREVCRATIGEIDVDEISELSELESAGDESSSADEMSSDEEADELSYVSLEGQQRDLEHTEYAVVPLRRRSKSNLTEMDLLFKVTPKNMEVEAGAAAKLWCKVEGTRPIDVAWFQGTKLLEPADKIDISRMKDVHQLTLFETGPATAGKYSCAVFNAAGEKWHDFWIHVADSTKPEQSPVMSTSPGDVCLDEKSSVRFSVTVEGFPEPRILFFRNDKRLRPNESVAIEHPKPGEWALILRRPLSKDSGLYAARATNKVGEAEKSWSVLVLPSEKDSSLSTVAATKSESQFNSFQNEKEVQYVLDYLSEVFLLNDLTRTNIKLATQMCQLGNSTFQAQLQ